jgi:hypothetical protein
MTRHNGTLKYHLTNMCIALHNENGVSCLTIIVNKRQLTMPYGGRNHKWHSLQAGVLKKCEEWEVFLYYSTSSCFNNFSMRLVLSILNMQIFNSFYKYLTIKSQ